MLIYMDYTESKIYFQEVFEDKCEDIEQSLAQNL